MATAAKQKTTTSVSGSTSCTQPPSSASKSSSISSSLKGGAGTLSPTAAGHHLHHLHHNTAAAVGTHHNLSQYSTSGGGSLAAHGHSGGNSSATSSGSNHHHHHSHHNTSSSGTNNFSGACESQSDIETIAKQISDHAEAIYQTWKARGLAPTEILNCHTGTSSDAFGKTLTPSSSASLSSSSSSSAHVLRNKDSSPVAELLAHAPDMSNNNLEKLVSSFVNEDKARQQAARKSNILTSGTIRDALRKFESADSGTVTVKPNYIRNSSGGQSIEQQQSPPSPATAQYHHQLQNKNKNNTYGTSSNNSNNIDKQSHLKGATTVTANNTNQLNQNVPDVLMNTFDQVLPNKVTQQPQQQQHRQKPETPAKPAKLVNHTPSWPLKNRLGLNNQPSKRTPTSNATKSLTSSSSSSHNNDNSGVSNNSAVSAVTAQQSGHDTIDHIGVDGPNDITSHHTQHGGSSNKQHHHNNSYHHHHNNIDQQSRTTTDLMDEISREEKRLINALKTGIVLNNLSDQSDLGDDSCVEDNNPNASEQLWLNQDVSSTSSLLLSPTLIANTTAAAKNIATARAGEALDAYNNKTAMVGADSPPIPGAAPNSGGATMQNKPWNDDQLPMKIGGVSNGNGNGNGGGSVMAGAMLGKPQDMLPQMKIIKPRPRNDAAVPHPEVKVNPNGNGTNLLNLRATAVNPVRPFLTRGSVAERVLMFEKCPDVKAPPRNREPSKLASKPSTKSSQTHTTLQRHLRSSSKNVYIPRFYYPHGKPLPTITIETTLQRLQATFDSFTNNQVSKENFTHIMKICNLPMYWRMPLFNSTPQSATGLIDGHRFIDFWKQMGVYCHDPASRFIYIMSRGQRNRSYILPEDLVSMVQDVVDTHPGLAFLKEAAEFHSRYVHTVIARIFYCVNRSWTGKITLAELRRSNLIQVITLLEEEQDINQIMAYFSYEHFYVIYCKFWELDRDHDLFIDQDDLARHNDHALSTRIIERIFSGCVTRGVKNRSQIPKMSYTEFVWFLLSEEDKTHPTAIEYWFRCMDLDGDGIVSMYELEYFYEEQQHRMEAIGIDTLPFEDCLCQMLDMIKPVLPGNITLGDLKRCKMTPIFFDTFFNLEKYMEHEQRDPFATQRDSDDGMSDWDRYAAQEYELLVAEEGGDTQGSYDEEDEYESNIDILESQLDDCMTNIINEW